MPRRRRAKTGMPDALVGVLLTVVGLIVIAALVFGAMWVRRTKVQLDQLTNCPLAGPRAVHVVIFDRSDPISGQQAQRIKHAMNELKTAAAFGYRFDIYTFEGNSKSALQPILSICSPNRPEDANEFIENPELIRRRYEEKFVQILDETVDFLLKESTRPTSPIIESLKAAAITSFGPLNEIKNIPLRVTLISDMVQHSPLYSQFRTESDFQLLSKNPIWPSLRPDLKGADTEIYYLLRPEAKRPSGAPIQTTGHQMFWGQVITAANGRITKIEPL